MIMLDTAACIDYLNGVKGIKNILSRKEKMLCTTTISVYEVNIGLERTKRKKSEQRYLELFKKWMGFLSGLQIFSFKMKEAEKAAKIHDILESKGKMIVDNDILIAGIMSANGIVEIITRNIQHFENIPDIEIISY
ncbi:MAG: type II toxin-antitoxin system VapC family toxin [Candidatus Helarchaeota archaeon]